MAESSRFAHLLQPIRDLSKVWNIEIADELEKYTEEVSQLLITNPDDGVSQLNFAEAALLIQGSTAIYSRKVELLYQLVFQALDLLAAEKGKDSDGSQQGRKTRTPQSGLWAPIPETDELLTIDHLIKEGRNITLERAETPPRTTPPQRRVPLFLMPRDPSDKRKSEFRISTCTVHHTGVYLLQESDAKLLDDMLAKDGKIDRMDTSPMLDAPLVPAPPQEVQDLDDRLQQLLKGIPPDSGVNPADDNWDTPVVDAPGQLVPNAPSEADAGALPEPADLAGGHELEGMGDDVKHFGNGKVHGDEKADAAKNSTVVADPWAMLDEHLPVPKSETPLEVGKASKRVNAKRLLVNAEGLPDIGITNARAAEDLWSTDSAAGNFAALMTAGNPVESLFLAVAGHLRSGGRYETLKAGFSPVWLEFEDLFATAVGKRRQQKLSSKGRTGPAVDGSDAELSDEEPMPAPTTPCKVHAAPQPADDPLTPGPCCEEIVPELTEEALRHEEQRREVAQLEGLIEDAQKKYESTIRDHLQMLQKDWVDLDNRKYPQLYANVKSWQDQLEPVLKEFESRPEFNIEGYSSKFLKKMQSLNKSASESDEITVPFPRLVHGQPRWEVCRRFLTCLLLTNQGNTDIVVADEAQCANGFSVKLLDARMKSVELEGEEAQPLCGAPLNQRKKAGPRAPASAAATRPAKRQRKAAG